INVDGTLINHSEKKVETHIIKKVVEMADKIGIDVCVCAGDQEEVELVSKMKPSYVAFEPPELIGSGKSVSKMKPEELKESVKIILDVSEKKSIPLCGAGISTKEDVALAIEYGARGILVASAFVKSKNKEEVLRDFSEAIEEKI
ncbi:MAG: triose-phosphate isomerase, partial [Candidatus Njordarchaeota archaeon]